ncbi:MAG: hypothetical protein GX285_07360 [Clostridiales bacterium]|nr:hypothetical protein [Clostridiales bacterium]
MESSIDMIKYNGESFEQLNDINEIVKIGIEDKYIYWINITGLGDINMIKKAGEYFKIDAADIQNIVDGSEWSKIEKRNHYLFSILNMIYLKNNNIIHDHISMVLVNNVLLTFQKSSNEIYEDMKKILFSLNIKVDIGSVYTCLLKTVIQAYSPVMSRFSDMFEMLEKEIENAKSKGEEPDKNSIVRVRQELRYLEDAVSSIKNAIHASGINEIYFKNDPYIINELMQMSEALNNFRKKAFTLLFIYPLPVI